MVYLGLTIDPADIYTYTFETPQGAVNSDEKSYNNIFNIVNPVDLVPKVAPSKWGFGRYGVDRYFPDASTSSRYSAYVQRAADNYKSFTGSDLPDEFTHYTLAVDVEIDSIHYYMINDITGAKRVHGCFMDELVSKAVATDFLESRRQYCQDMQAELESKITDYDKHQLADKIAGELIDLSRSEVKDCSEYSMSQGRYTHIVNYYDAELTSGSSYTGTIGAAVDGEAGYTLQTEAGETVPVSEDLTGDASCQYTVVVDCAGDGYVAGGGSFERGEYAVVVASSELVAEFLGWYSGDTLLTAEAEYRFCVTADTALTAKFTNAPQYPEQCTFALDESSTSALAVVRLSNDAETALKGIFVVAAYDADGQLVGIEMVSGKLYPDGPVTLTVTSTGNAIALVKDFILDQETKPPLAASWQQSLKNGQ